MISIADPVAVGPIDLSSDPKAVTDTPAIAEPIVQAQPQAVANADADANADEDLTEGEGSTVDDDEGKAPADRRASRPAGQRERHDGPAPEPIRFADVVSGQFDANENSPEGAPLKRVLAPQADTPKLHKVLAQAGLGSRLEMEQLILQGRISVNNEPAHIGQRIQYGDQIKVNGKPIRYRIAPPPVRVIAYHKPAGEVVTHDDPQNRPTVFRKLPRLAFGKWQSVGRLDLNTEGLLLFTSSGELANKLMHPRFGLEREYAVRVLGALSQEEKQRLLDGVPLDDGMAQFGLLEEGGGEGANCWYRVTIREGRNREVRRMFEVVGHAVSRLIRIRYGAMVLPRGLKRGAWIELDERDIRALMQAAGLPGDQPRRTGSSGAGNAGARSSRNQRGPAKGMGAQWNGGAPRDELRSPPGPAKQRRGAAGQRKGKGAGGGAQPDPMKTSLGYIGATSFTRQRGEQQRNSGRRRNR
ncbi:MAG: rRNA pseudouridine synthase [Burkholderiaceae bacterium]|jgi:23S rRNA pseudouridine2605 synthase|nr:rRNA pseudouridine synthase [Burkholderiaceae bacterium]